MGFAGNTDHVVDINLGDAPIAIGLFQRLVPLASKLGKEPLVERLCSFIIRPDSILSMLAPKSWKSF